MYKLIRNKRGISELAFYLLSLVFVLIGVLLVWVAIVPMIRNTVTVSNECAFVDVSINEYSSYTCYSSEVTLIQIKKGSENSNVTSIKFYLSSGGDNYFYQKDFVLAPNTEKTFYMNSKDLGKIDEVKVVPVVKSVNVEKDCTPVVARAIQACISQDISGRELLEPGLRTP